MFSGIQTSGGRIKNALLSACASTTLIEALRKSGAYLVEPIMLIEIDVFDDNQSGGFAHSAILQELTKRRAIILDAQADDLTGLTLFLRQLFTYLLFSTYEENHSRNSIGRIDWYFSGYSKSVKWISQFSHGLDWLSERVVEAKTRHILTQSIRIVIKRIFVVFGFVRSVC